MEAFREQLKHQCLNRLQLLVTTHL